MKAALEKAQLTFDDMDLIEINEAFACQFAACHKELGFDMDKANLNGGAVALGHPTGASGSRIMGHLSYELQRTGKKYAIGAACKSLISTQQSNVSHCVYSLGIGGGQGIAIVIERC